MDIELKISGEIIDVRDGTHDSPKYIENGYPLITSKNLKNGKIILDDANLISKDDFDKINKRSKVDKGDILYSMIGTIGNFSIVESQPDYAIKNVALFKFENDIVYNRYFYYVLSSNFVKQQIELQQKGGTQKFVTLKILRNLKIPLPPLTTQKRIAKILDQAAALKEKTELLLKEYDSLAQSIFLDMFGDPGLNPKGWKTDVFGEYIDVLTDYHANGSYQTLNKHVTLKTEKNFALMVRTTDLENNNFDKGVNYITEDAYKFLTKSKVFGGEIIINKIGSAGKVYLMPFLNRPVSLGMNAFLLRLNKKMDVLFAYFFLTSKFGEWQISKRVKGAVTKTIRKDAVRAIPFIVPPIELQNQFSEKIALIEQQKALAKQELAESEALFACLLQKAFKGEL